MKKRRLISIFLSLTLAAGLSVAALTSCGDSGSTNSGNGGNSGRPAESITESEQDEYYKSFDPADYPVKGDVSVTVQMCGVGKEWITDLAANYKKITGITVKVKESQDATAELTNKFATGAGLSDLYFDWSSLSEMYTWASKGYLEELTDLVGEVAEYRDDTLALIGQYKEKTYTMPFAYQPTGFVYNQDYLDRIDSYGAYKKGEWPKTWQGLLDLCAATKNSNLKVGAVKVMPYVFPGTLATYTPYIFNSLWKSEDPEGFNAYWSQNDATKNGFKKELLVTEATEKVMQAMRDLINPQLRKGSKTEYYPANVVNGSTGINHTKAQTQFLNGAAVFCLSGSWFENEMKETLDENSSYHFGTFPVLTEGNKAASYITASPSEHFTVPKSASNAAGGKQFLKFILQKQNVIRIVNKVQIPLAYKYDNSEVKLGTWGEEVHEAVVNTVSANPFTSSDVMHSGALTVFGNGEPMLLMGTKGYSAKKIIEDEAQYRYEQFEYFLNLLPKDNTTEQ